MDPTPIAQLRDKANETARAANALLESKGSSPWTEQDQATYDNYIKEIKLVRAQIKAHEDLRALEADKFFEAAAQKGTKPGAHQVEGQLSPIEIVSLYFRKGSNLSPEELTAIQNTMSTTTGSEGGFTVPSEIATMLIEQLKAFGGMRGAAYTLPTTGGNPLNYPTTDGTAEEGEIVAENQEVGRQDISFGTVPLNPYKYTSKVVAIPWELISDTVIDVVGLVIRRLAERLGRVTNKHYTVGTGTGEPWGLVTRAGTGKVGATGQTQTIKYGDVVDLIRSVDVAYRNGARFMMHDLTLGVVDKLVDNNGRPIWVPGVSSGGLADAPPDTLHGRRIVINNDMPLMGANAKSIAFGDFGSYHIRDVTGSVIMRRFDDSPFAVRGQVGFCSWMRTGGNLLNPSAVKLYVNSAS